MLTFTIKTIRVSINEWIRNREIRGIATFSVEDLRNDFAVSSNKGLKTELRRLVARGRILSVYRGFYVIIPVQYQLKGVVPANYYIDELMQYIGKSYYIGLLSAAAMHGAAHQRAMVTQVVTLEPRLKASNKNPLLDWNYRQVIPEGLIMTKNAEMGIMRYSGVELTAVDLIQFATHVGGYQRAATVLAELTEALDMIKMQNVLKYTTTATIQRLGYLLEYVLYEQEKADALFRMLKEQKGKWNMVRMSNDHTNHERANGNRWRVNMNIDIEIDDL